MEKAPSPWLWNLRETSFEALQQTSSAGLLCFESQPAIVQSDDVDVSARFKQIILMEVLQ